MAGLVVIFLFAILMFVPMCYIVIRKIFPKSSKRMTLWVTLLLTILLIAGLTIWLAGAKAV